MRRGLMAWDAEEIPIGALTRRVGRLQAAMADAKQDAFILYTNFVRSGAVSYLTAFSPYWADGVLLVPQQGEPLFATTLSKRVASWIQSVKPIGDLVNTPTPGKTLGERLAAAGKLHRLAILELDDFPSGLYSELAAVLPDVDIVDGSEAFAQARGVLDAVESRLLRQADAIAKAALDRVKPDAADAGEAVAAVERHARLRGAEEVYIAIAPDLDGDRRFIRWSGRRPLGRRFAIRATVAYKGSWTRRIGTYVRDSHDRFAIARAETWFDTFRQTVDVNRPLRDRIAASLASLPDAELVNWMVETPVGTHPLAVVASSDKPCETLKYAPVLVITASLRVDRVPWCGAGLTSLLRLSA